MLTLQFHDKPIHLIFKQTTKNVFREIKFDVFYVY